MADPTTLLMLLAGLVLLGGGGEILVRGAVGAAKSLGVSPLLIGLTVVGFGTSTPELVTSLTAAFADSPGIAIGNVVGSNIANVLLILGLTAVIWPIAVDPAAFRRDRLALMGATLAVLGAGWAGVLTRPVGLAFLAALVGYIAWAYLSERAAGAADPETGRHEREGEAAPAAGGSVALSLVLAVVGIALTIFGARLLVGAAITIAQGLGVSDLVIGLTVVAVGTSLPELVACLLAAWRGQSDIALGNIVGSNIFNILAILGVTATITPIAVPPGVMELDIWVLLATTVLLLVFVRTGWTVKRWEGAVFVALYVAYAAWLVTTSGAAA